MSRRLLLNFTSSWTITWKAKAPRGAANRHNGSSRKTMLKGTSKVTLDVPRDRRGHSTGTVYLFFGRENFEDGRGATTAREPLSDNMVHICGTFSARAESLTVSNTRFARVSGRLANLIQRRTFRRYEGAEPSKKANALGCFFSSAVILRSPRWRVVRQCSRDKTRNQRP